MKEMTESKILEGYNSRDKNKLLTQISLLQIHNWTQNFGVKA